MAGAADEVKTVVFGITGGIAAYKAPLIVRALKAHGFDVHTILTEAGSRFVTPYTLQAVSGRPVYSEMFRVIDSGSYAVEHVALADRAKLLLIAPASANCLAKLAGGIADDPLSCTALATRAPLLVCPSMNANMYTHPATRRNLDTLKSRGVHILEPETGELACGWEGPGRLPAPERIADEVRRYLHPQGLAGRRILITCGPTAEDIDPVRFITNRSTGRMGRSLVEAACLQGAEVRVITGPVNLTYAPWAQVFSVRSAGELLAAVQAHLDWAEVLIMAAAVADYVPREYRGSKIKKGSQALKALELASSPDILATIAPDKGARVFVGFAAETDDVAGQGLDKLRRKGLDLIVANQVGKEGTGFAAETNTGLIITSGGTQEPFERMDKGELARRILDHVRDRL